MGGVQADNGGMERPHGFTSSSYHSKSPILKLEVGGKAFVMTKATINRFPDSLLADTVQECPEILDSDRPLFIDRSPQGFEVILDIYRTGGFDSARLPKDDDIGHLAEDLDFYKLPCLKKLIKHVDAKALDLISRISINAAIDGMLNQLFNGHPRNIVGSVKFYMIWEEPEKLVASTYWPCHGPPSLGSANSRRHLQAYLNRGGWRQVEDILWSRGFQVESKADRNFNNRDQAGVKLRATYGSIDISIA